MANKIMYVVWSLALSLAFAPLSAQTHVTATSDRTVSVARITLDADDVSLRDIVQEIARQAGLHAMYDGTIISSRIHITLHVRQIPVDEVFQTALRGTGLTALVRPTGNVSIVRTLAEGLIPGAVGGIVTDAKTKQPLRGVTVLLDDAVRGAVTGVDGTFRFPTVNAGTHRIAVRLLGYLRQVRTVTVADDQTSSVDIGLEAGTNTLEQVVVTGMVIPTELKAVPNAMTVITAKQIEERGITHIDQLFRGDVPGVFAQNQGSNSSSLLDEVMMFSRGTTALSGASAGTFGFTNPIKTYVDGVELANPQYLSQIDPKSIERIEILTGPQASTIYGSNAINGVMQIFTKRGTSNTPQLTLNLLSGFVQNNFSNALTPQHDYSAQINGIEGRFAYNAGSSWNYVGPWTPAKQTTRFGGFGGARLDMPVTIGHVTADVTFRRGITQNQERGSAGQTFTAYLENGWWDNSSGGAGIGFPQTHLLTGQTLGFVLGYMPMSWWSHEVAIGTDVVDAETRYTTRRYLAVSDTTLLFGQNHTDRRSLHYTTTAHIPVTPLVQATMTTGVDGWQEVASAITSSSQMLTGTLTGTTNISRQPGHNTGGFMQIQLGVLERLYVTYGLRAEWNPNFGQDAQPNYAPRSGIAYAQDLGEFTVKVRASYGRSTRPPLVGYRAAQTASATFGAGSPTITSYGNFDRYLANPELGPEHQQGGEGGVELYVGTRGSLVATRYNQTVDGLIDAPIVDSVRSLIPNPPGGVNSRDADGYGYLYQYEYLNVGSIRNQGWELQGSMNTGPFTTHGTYSWTKSRTIGVAARYRAYFAGNPQYQPGATFQFLPEHTWALGITYAHAQTTLGLNVTGTGLVENTKDDFSFRNLDFRIRLPQNRQNVNFRVPYISFNRGYALTDFMASHRFASRIEGVLQVQNLMDHYTNDLSAAFATMGRQVKIGVRYR